ncbi:MAG: 50S ribosomal protein L18 [Bacteroidia bacterium]|nr:50S ribosomal protein L18 [Bacteroidia bacterium]MCX7652699.1 50S ribosomal protein L18 [Bacteroidia bacterium]MDW8416417.1 50S ribosomal protein L18 [Bacteroidia bacterium]
MQVEVKAYRRFRIKRRIRKKVFGTPERPRLSVFRSNKYIYAQLIDDTKGRTLVSASSREPEVQSAGARPLERSRIVGQKLAERAKAAGIQKVVFDRNGYQYHGNVRALAEGAREGGLIF